MLLFKKILDFQKTAGGLRDKRGAKRYPVGAKFQLKAKVALSAHDGEGNALPPDKAAPMDWGGQLANLSNTGLSIRLHPAAVAGVGETCTLKLELDNRLFETEGKVAQFRVSPQYVTCGLALTFPDNYTRKAYLQFMEPVVIGSTLEPVPASKVKQDLPGLAKEQYTGESGGVLSVWHDASGKNPKLFELLFHDYCIRGNTEIPGLKIGYRDGAKAGKRVSRPSFPVTMPPSLKAEVQQLYRLVVPNLSRSVPAEVRRFLELFAV
ncbi:MAG: PilZ domain-containing protein [Verrucomicrobiota bacterium]